MNRPTTPTRLTLFLAAILLSTACRLQAAQAMESYESPVDSNPGRLLAATLVITFTTPQTDEAGQPIVLNENGRKLAVMNQSAGLGTVVSSGANTYVVTHDHASFLEDTAVTITITDATGRTLAYLNGDAFRQLIRYRDGTVMLFDAPPGLPAGLPAGNGDNIRAGSQVNVVHLDSETGALSVVVARVERHEQYLSSPGLRLLNLGGEIVVPGNSGGGVMSAGRVVASLTATILADESGPVPPRLMHMGAPSAGSYASSLSVARMPELYSVQSIASTGSSSNP